jgi:hypothetical protein
MSWWWNRWVMILRVIARASGIVQSAMACPFAKKIFKVFKLYSKPSSFKPRETSSLEQALDPVKSVGDGTYPVSSKKTPTPPMQL